MMTNWIVARPNDFIELSHHWLLWQVGELNVVVRSTRALDLVLGLGRGQAIGCDQARSIEDPKSHVRNANMWDRIVESIYVIAAA